MNPYLHKILSILFFLSLANYSNGQKSEIDSLLQKVHDENISELERDKVKLEILEYQKAKLASKNNYEFPLITLNQVVDVNKIDSLILLINNDLVPDFQKMKYLIVLSQTNHDRAYDFLTDKMSKIYFSPSELTSEDIYLYYYAFYVLNQKENKWSLFPFLMESLEEERDEMHIHLVSILLVEMTSKNNTLLNELLKNALLAREKIVSRSIFENNIGKLKNELSPSLTSAYDAFRRVLNLENIFLETQHSRDSIYQSLVEIIESPDNSRASKEKAVFLLAKMHDIRSLTYLLENSKTLNFCDCEKLGSEEAQQQHSTALYAIFQEYSDDDIWLTIPVWKDHAWIFDANIAYLFYKLIVKSDYTQSQLLFDFLIANSDEKQKEIFIELKEAALFKNN